MRRRIIVEIETADTIPGAMLEAITNVSGALENMKNDDLIIDYGIALEAPATWFFKIAAQAPPSEELGHGAGEEVQGSTN